MKAEIIQAPFGQANKTAKGAGGERIKRRADGLYQLEKRYRLPDGTPKKKSFYGKTQAEVQEKRRAFERELESGANVEARDVLVRSYAEQWISTYKTDVKPNTLKTYRHDVDLIIAAFGGKRLRDVQSSDIRALLNSRAGLSRSSLRKTRMTVNAIFAQAIADRIISYNPALGVAMPKADSGTHRALEAWERDLILNPPREHPFQLAMMLMLCAGLRRGEALALDLGTDVDLSAGVLHVRRALSFEGNRAVIGNTKTVNSIRDVPIMPPLADALRRVDLHGLAAPGASGGYMSSSAFKSAWRSYTTMMEEAINGATRRWATDAQRAAWKPWTVRCHDLRHDFTTQLYDAGVDVKSAQRILGHADVQTTLKIYTHLSENRYSQAVENAKNFFAKNVGKNVGKDGATPEFNG